MEEFTLEEFRLMLVSGFINQYDGSAYLVNKEGKETIFNFDEVFPKDANIEKVRWFNK